jgi:predicted CXXCH cytochrome family protein
MTISRIPDLCRITLRSPARPRRGARLSRAPLLTGLLAAWCAAAAIGAAGAADPVTGTGGAAPPESCTTAQCHATLLKGKTVHAATDPCTNCHESIATPHPQKGKHTFKLSAEPPTLCQTCHDAFTKKDIHPPAKEGLCTTCHDPHSSDQPKLLTQPLKELCTTCHSEVASAKFPHGPVSAGDCTACHAPHESDNPRLLVRPGDELCATCHLEVPAWLKKSDVHPALEGGCTSCHSPHGGDHPKLLAEAGAALCFQCHDTIADKVKTSGVQHPALKDVKECVACHSPHSSDHAKLLVKTEVDTCLGCHKTIVTKEMTTLHGPIAKGQCTACHDPHGSVYAKLLEKEFPAQPYVPYTDSEFALCFSCHNRDLVQYPDTSYATNFRDGERNLHYLHVNNKQKGRSCTMCHAVHGSASPVLIAQSVPFGKWSLPLKFVKTESGGSCAPGCHKPQTYDRKSPGKKPAAG